MNRLGPFDGKGRRVHLVDEGEGAPVVLLHSSGMSGHQWKRLAEAARAAGHRTIVPDFLGSGASSAWPFPEPFSFRDDVDLLSELLARLGERAHLVGHSYGGFIGLQAALRAPATARSLSLYDPVAFGALDRARDDDALRNLHSLAFSYGETDAEHEAWLASFVTFWNGEGAWSSVRGATRAEFLRTGWVAYEGARTLVADETRAEAYRAIAAPLLLLTGEKTPLAEARVVTRLAEALPSCELVRLDGAGHMGPLTHVDAVNARILTHLARAS